MKNRFPTITPRHVGAGLLAVATFVSVGQNTFAAQPVPDPTHAAHVASGAMPPDAPQGDPALSQQISELQTKVAQLEAALAQSAPPMAAAPAGTAMPGMPAAPVTPPMSMGMDKMKSRSAMPANGGDAPAPLMPRMSGGMGMEKKKMAAMMGMGSMGNGTTAAMPESALPGYPGASHLYHIGATDFFLDHPQHIALTTQQQAGLNKAKEQATLAKSTADRAVEQAEQELWMLTAADLPDATAIQAKIAAIGKLTGDERLAFIRAVGDASKILTDEQRKSLTGFAPPAPANAMAAPAADPMAGGMKDM